MSVKKIFYNTVLQSVGKVISVVIGLVVIAQLTRYLGSVGYGEYTTVSAYMGFVGVLADLGLYLVAAREISRQGADEAKILGNIFSLRIITVVAMLVTGALIAGFLPYAAGVKRAMFIGILAFSFVSGTQVLVGVFQKHLVFYQLIGSEIAGRLVMLATTWLFIRQQWGLDAFIWSLALANGAHFFISTYLARRLIPFRLEFDFGFWKKIMAQAWPLAFSVVLNLIYFKADTIILSVLKPAEDVGLYGLSYKFLEVLLAFPAMFAGLIMPFLSRFAFADWPQYRLYLQKSLDAIILAIVPMITVVLFFARPIINVVGGAIYPNADAVLRILIFATGIIYVGNLLGYNVVALGAQKKMVLGYLTGTIVGLGLYFLLIPRFTYYGAAAGTVAVEATVATYAYLLTSRVSGYFPRFGILLKALAAAAPMALLYRFLRLEWVVSMALGLGVYLGVLYLIRAIPQDFIREVLARRQAGSGTTEIIT